EPLDGKTPDKDKLRAIEGFSDLAAIAIQNTRLYEQLDEDRKKVEILLDLIGHDINNYTQAVSGFIELGLSRKDVPEPTRKSMAKALDQIWNLTKLVSNVKLYGKVETSGDKDLRPMDLVGTIKEAFSEARDFTPYRQIRMALHDDDEKKLSVMNSLAKDIFLNLFTNAIKFDPHESVVVEVSVEEKVEERRPMWTVSVADRGPGVADEMKEVIFNRFSKGGAPRSSSGLGLHIAKTLVTIYKGRIWVEDRVPGDRSKGSVFKVTLPKCEKAA
ncbi:MAG TPA: HAMP domain-containing sensor histidine kinase, partial [Thermoplasmata archaeon]|nr:HAMP domain-containing sensor histidine kinase [Thermoplasmata archaeon]